MADIKIKDKNDKGIKVIDKSVVATERFKDTLVSTKEKSESVDGDNIYSDGADKIKNANDKVVDEIISNFNKYGKKATIETKNNIKKLKSKKNKSISIPSIKTKANNIAKVSSDSLKGSQRAMNYAKNMLKKTTSGVKKTAKKTLSSLKTIIAGTRALIAALLSIGWFAIFIVILICLVSLLCSSFFGIFFSSEDTGNAKTMSSVIEEINQEMANKISQIQKENTYDDYVIESNRADWKDVLAVYTVRISKGINATDVITLDDNKINILKKFFWDMNSVSSEVKLEKVKNSSGIDEDKKILYIKINSKSVEEMSKQYLFNGNQIKQLNELLDEKYSNLWSNVIYGSSIGSKDIVKIAISQIGNVGGQPYWSWYGFSSRVEWCACFVSWVANQAGYIEKNIIPKFSGVQNGVEWFKAMGQYKNNNYIPKKGEIIFFDWEQDGHCDHVGIVEKVEGGKVYTIEGNSGDKVQRQKYKINSKNIYGYGTPTY